MGAKPPRGSRLLARRVQRGLPDRTGLTEPKDRKGFRAQPEQTEPRARRASRGPPERMVQTAHKGRKAFRAFRALLAPLAHRAPPDRPLSPLTLAIPPRSGRTT